MFLVGDHKAAGQTSTKEKGNDLLAYFGFLADLVVRESLDYFCCLYRIVGSSVDTELRPRGIWKAGCVSERTTDPNPIQETNALEASAWKNVAAILKTRGWQGCGHGSSVTQLFLDYGNAGVKYQKSAYVSRASGAVLHA